MTSSKSNGHTKPNPPAGPALLMLRHSQCKTHPNNMRRVYPAADVRQMAESIRAHGGLLHALLVEDSGDGTYIVIDGNMRLAGARLLGEECPLLKSEVIAAGQVEQYLTMAAANTVRFDVDPISEALHYQRLLAEGLSKIDVAERSGTYYTRVDHRLRMLDLDPPLQDLVAERRLPITEAAIEALLAIPDGAARVKLGRRMAEQGASAKAIVAAAAVLRERLEAQGAQPVAKRKPGRPKAPVPLGMQVVPMTSLAQDRSGYGLPNGHRPAWPAVRSAARQMCAACDIKVETLRNAVDEPAWVQIVHAAGETCENCNVRDVIGACNGCPGVELLTRLFRSANAKTPTVAETAPTESRV